MSENNAAQEKKLEIKILGPGCKNCTTLEGNTKEALRQMNIEAEVEKITDVVKIAGYGIMSTPGLVVNGKVVSFGKVLKAKDVIKILEKTI
jgi:small redox-active disulfide protein 2